MKIYRVEDRIDSKLGFYRFLRTYNVVTCNSYNVNDSFYDIELHPHPLSHLEEELGQFYWNQLNYTERKEYYFGFHTKRLLNRWFNIRNKDVIDILCQQANLMIREYKCDQAVKFNYQCVFKLDKAEKLDEYHFSEIFRR